jgi:hypothetical protein
MDGGQGTPGSVVPYMDGGQGPKGAVVPYMDGGQAPKGAVVPYMDGWKEKFNTNIYSFSLYMYVQSSQNCTVKCHFGLNLGHINKYKPRRFITCSPDPATAPYQE